MLCDAFRTLSQTVIQFSQQAVTCRHYPCLQRTKLNFRVSPWPPRLFLSISLLISTHIQGTFPNITELKEPGLIVLGTIDTGA